MIIKRLKKGLNANKKGLCVNKKIRNFLNLKISAEK